jgi:hypothetical protein
MTTKLITISENNLSGGICWAPDCRAPETHEIRLNNNAMVIPRFGLCTKHFRQAVLDIRVQSKPQPGFACQECGHKFRTVRAAERASFGQNGCPKCGGSDIDNI